MTEIQFELLERVSQRGRPEEAIPRQFAGEWESFGLVGSAQSNVDGFVREGLLEYVPISALEKKFTRPQLQSLLRERGIEPIGKKADLAKLIVASLQASELDSMIAGLDRYVMTPAGKQAIDGYHARKVNRRALMESGVRSSLLNGDILEAARCIEVFNSAEAFKMPWLPKWQDGKLCQLGRRAEYLISLPYEDLPFTNDVRRDIGAELALAVLIGEKVNIATILEITGGVFTCNSLEDFISHKPCGRIGDAVAESEDYDEEDRHRSMAMLLSPASLAFEYALTKQAEAANECNLKELLEWRDEEGFRGIEILTGGTKCCHICGTGKLRYKWSDISTMPRLPRHWSCTCGYVTW